MPQALRPHQRAALRVLAVNGPLPASRLARLVGHSPREAVEFARRLSARGYVHVAGGSWGHSPIVSLVRRGSSPGTVLAAVLLALLALPAPVSAQDEPGTPPAAALGRRPCGRLVVLAAALAERFGEAPVVRGLAEGGSLLVIFASPDGDTWTAAQVSPTGVACVVATGRDLTGAGKAAGRAGQPS